MRIVISGVSRGIGLELVRQCLARGDSVLGAARAPESARELQELRASSGGRLVLAACDVSDAVSVKRFAEQVRTPVDALINNAGVMGTPHPLGKLDFTEALEVLSVNALGPLRLTEALLPQLRAGKDKKVLHITSGMGSIADNTSGGYYAYRMSKAALNMASRSLAVDLRSEGILSAVINPGWVKTDMGGRGAPTQVADSVRGILAQLDAMSPQSSGAFLDFGGKYWDW